MVVHACIYPAISLIAHLFHLNFSANNNSYQKWQKHPFITSQRKSFFDSKCNYYFIPLLLTCSPRCATRQWCLRSEATTGWRGSPSGGSSWTRVPRRWPRTWLPRTHNRARSARRAGCAQQLSAHTTGWTVGRCPWPKSHWNYRKKVQYVVYIVYKNSNW